MLAVVDSQRPTKLYRYSQQPWLERSLTLGEFRLSPAMPVSQPSALINAGQILPFQSKKPQTAAAQHYLALRWASAWDAQLFDIFAPADACLVVHNPELLGERIHRAVQKALPNWAGIDAAISYGATSPLGAAFSKSRLDAMEKEWLFAWRPMQSAASLHPLVIQIGSIENIAELRLKA